MTQLKTLHAEWMEDRLYAAAYDGLREEFTLASALIAAREQAKMTQERIAAAMGTSQAAVARLESGRISTTTRTLEKYAKATGTRLCINFER